MTDKDIRARAVDQAAAANPSATLGEVQDKAQAIEAAFVKWLHTGDTAPVAAPVKPAASPAT